MREMLQQITITDKTTEESDSNRDINFRSDKLQELVPNFNQQRDSYYKDNPSMPVSYQDEKIPPVPIFVSAPEIVKGLSSNELSDERRKILMKIEAGFVLSDDKENHVPDGIEVFQGGLASELSDKKMRDKKIRTGRDYDFIDDLESEESANGLLMPVECPILDQVSDDFRLMTFVDSSSDDKLHKVENKSASPQDFEVKNTRKERIAQLKKNAMENSKQSGDNLQPIFEDDREGENQLFGNFAEDSTPWDQFGGSCNDRGKVIGVHIRQVIENYSDSKKYRIDDL